MNINFTKLQRTFIEKIKREENLTLRGTDVSFIIEPNYEVEQHHLKVRLTIFGEEFSVGYVDDSTTEADLIDDFYSRLHDYDVYGAEHQLLVLKILQLENRFSEEIASLREKIIHNHPEIKPEEIMINFSDFAPSELDERGFPKFEVFVVIKGEQLVTHEIGFDEFNYTLGEELEAKILEKL